MAFLLRDTGCEMWDNDTILLFRVEGRTSHVYLVSRISYPATHISQPATRISYPATRISHLASRNPYLASRIPHPASRIPTLTNAPHPFDVRNKRTDAGFDLPRMWPIDQESFPD